MKQASGVLRAISSLGQIVSFTYAHVKGIPFIHSNIFVISSRLTYILSSQTRSRTYGYSTISRILRQIHRRRNSRTRPFDAFRHIDDRNSRRPIESNLASILHTQPFCKNMGSSFTRPWPAIRLATGIFPSRRRELETKILPEAWKESLLLCGYADGAILYSC